MPEQSGDDPVRPLVELERGQVTMTRGAREQSDLHIEGRGNLSDPTGERAGSRARERLRRAVR
jgi:hypothetical protein